MRNKVDSATYHHQPSFYIWNPTGKLVREPIPYKVFEQISDKTKLDQKDENKILKEFADVLEMESTDITSNHISIFKTFTKLLKSSPELTSSAKQLLTSILKDLEDE